jgi:hypothetical protein
VAPGAYADEHCTFYTYQSLKQSLEAHGYEVANHGYICHAELIFQAVLRSPARVSETGPERVKLMAAEVGPVLDPARDTAGK